MTVAMTAPNRMSAGDPPTLPRGDAGGRLLWVDLGRSAALAGMILFHFVRDLEMFGWIAPGTTLTGGWALFARLVAASFLFLSGVSLVLAHRRGVRWRAWGRRLGTIGAAAALVSAATYALYPAQFIYFGILHAIAAASVIGVLLRPAPAGLLLAGALAIVVADAALGRGALAAPWLAWTGLAAPVRPSLDFIPLVPWLAAFLAGMAFAKGVRPVLRAPGRPPAGLWRRLAWPGRHSLAVYLIHQPVLYGLFWLAGALAATT